MFRAGERRGVEEQVWEGVGTGKGRVAKKKARGRREGKGGVREGV